MGRAITLSRPDSRGRCCRCTRWSGSPASSRGWTSTKRVVTGARSTAQLGLKVPQIEAYVQSHAVAALGPTEESDVPLGFDGYASCWFADEESYREALQTPGVG